MAYESIEDKRRKARDRMQRWRSIPENILKQNKRRKELRGDSFKIKAKEYYQKNREHILQRCKVYQKENPQVKKRYQTKAKEQGKGVLKGKRERKELSNSYISAQIRKGKIDKTIQTKEAEILIYRIKQLIKKHE